MKNLFRILVLAAAVLAAPAYAQFTPGQVLTAAQLNSALAAKTNNTSAAITGGSISGLSTPIPIASGGTGATTGNAALSNMGVGSMAFQNASAVSITGGSIAGLTTPLSVANGGTGATTGSGTLLDNLSGFSGTGYIQRTGAGTYTFVSATNGISYSTLAQAPANTVLANVTGSTANVVAFAMPGCGAISDALQYNPGTGFYCAVTVGSTTLGLNQFASTTSAQLASVISDGTGSGALVFGTSPTIASPAISNPTVSGTIAGIPGRLLNVQIFTASGTYTPTAGTGSIIVYVLGGGGGGGGTQSTGGTTVSAGSGGGSGGLVVTRITSGVTSTAVTIGAGGAGGALATNGVAGGSTSFGSYTAGGGGAGTLGVAGTVSNALGGAGGTASGGNLLNIPGNQYGNSLFLASGGAVGGFGASSPLGLGAGGPYGPNAQGSAGSGYGSGGGSAVTSVSSPGQRGGAGANGLVIVYEYQ